MLAPDLSTELSRFAIGFDHRDRALLHQLWDRVLDSERWSEGELTTEFEREWSTWNRLEAVAFNGWTGAALAALEWAGVRGETVLCPSNTFMATPLAAISAGANVEFVDCNRDDLCMSFDDLERKVREHKPRAVFLVHIGGHLAFQVRPDRRALPERGDRPARGLRPRPRRRMERPSRRQLGRCRDLVVRADEDDLHRRGRHARVRGVPR